MALTCVLSGEHYALALWDHDGFHLSLMDTNTLFLVGPLVYTDFIQEQDLFFHERRYVLVLCDVRMLPIG